MIFLLDCNHQVHTHWHIGVTKAKNETGDESAQPDVADILDRFLIKLDNLREYMTTRRVGRDARFLAVFDSTARPKRCDLMADYKANRTRIAGIAECVADAKEAVRMSDEWELWIAPDGYEADDLICSLAYQSDGRVVIHSPDKDLNQCLEPARVSIMKRSAMMPLGNNDNGIELGSELVPEWYTYADFQDEYGFPVEQWIDYQCMTGDSADNVAGAKWVGAKKAKEILQSGHFPYGCEGMLNKRQLAEWGEFLERLMLLREVFTLRNDLKLGACNHGACNHS